MNIKITFEDQEYEVFLYAFQYWNQRFFCLGQSTCGTLFKKFISTKGFDELLIENTEGPSFIFKKDHFNPYLCSKEKDVWHESQQIQHHGNNFSVNDIGPNDYSGSYTQIRTLGPYRDDTYFETRPFVKPDFDLFQYQNDDLYFIQHQSINKDKLPVLTCLMDADLYGKINIIHGVTDNNDEIFDLQSVFKIVDTDLAFPEKNGLFLIGKRSDKLFILHPLKYGTLEFYKSTELQQLSLDCGNSYIRAVVLHRNVKRKYALRYLYEYFNFTKQLTSSRRRTSAPAQIGPKEFKQSEFSMHFDYMDTSVFRIIYYTDVFTIDRKNDLLELVPAQQEFSINGRYDFVSSSIIYDDFPNTATMLKRVREVVNISQSIKLAKLVGQWLALNYGYAPRLSRIPVAAKANSNSTNSILTLIHIPILEEDGKFYGTNTYVNFHQFLSTFGIHIPQIRNVLKMDWFTTEIYRVLQTTFPIYHISRDYRRPLFNWDNDTELSSSMISIEDATRLIHLFRSTSDKKNTYWYNNANTILCAFPKKMLQPPTFI